jgi:hypothetical protein
MKKSLFVTILLTCLASATFAQANFGVKGGLNLYNINNKNGDNLNSKAGIHLGLLAHLHVTERFALQPELYYSMQGAENGGANVNLNYINVPLLFQYMFDNGFRLQAGPQVGILTSARLKNDGESVGVKSAYNSLEFGLPLGVGYVSPSGFGVDARYHLGLSNIREDDNNKAMNRGFQLGVFYLFKHE